MKEKTKAVLLHLGIAVLCALMATGAGFLAYHLHTLNPAQEKDDAKFYAWIVFIFGLCFLAGFFIHLIFVRSKARVHCPKCGAKADLVNYQTLKQNKASDGIHISSEKVLINMRCPACRESYSLKKKFTVSTYNSKHRYWTVRNVDSMVYDYASGQAWF